MPVERVMEAPLTTWIASKVMLPIGNRAGRSLPLDPLASAVKTRSSPGSIGPTGNQWLASDQTPPIGPFQVRVAASAAPVFMHTNMHTKAHTIRLVPIVAHVEEGA